MYYVSAIRIPNEAMKCTRLNTYAKPEQNQHRKHPKKDDFAVDVQRFIGGFGGRVEMSLYVTLGRY